VDRSSSGLDQSWLTADPIVERIDLGRGSWVDVVRALVPDPEQVTADLLSGVSWSGGRVFRYERWVDEPRLGGFQAGADRHPVLAQAGDWIERRYRVSFDGVALAQYRHAADSVGFHRDREMRWLEDTLIAIVVLGARRPFVLRPRGDRVPVERVPAGEHPDDVVLMPGEGDLLVMGGANQREWLHGVPAAPGVTEPRISLTWRWTSRRGRPDTAPTFYDGRSFSDDVRRPGTRQRRI